ncbi:hypothetical protein PC116_g4915 [Phytophthora cactorum]|nr:hypothetical protein PC116_g4915 [Phytophthora cactorum]
MYQGRRVSVLRWARNYSAIAAACATRDGESKKKARAKAQMLRLKALHAAKELGIAKSRASPSWQRRIKQSHRLSLRAPTELGVSVIYNADQTAAFFEYLPSKTLHRTGDKTVWVRCGGKSKERATVMHLGDSNGKKFPPFIVFKAKPSTVPQRREANARLRNGFGITVWNEVGPLEQHDNVQAHGNAKCW